MTEELVGDYGYSRALGLITVRFFWFRWVVAIPRKFPKFVGQTKIRI